MNERSFIYSFPLKIIKPLPLTRNFKFAEHGGFKVHSKPVAFIRAKRHPGNVGFPAF